MVSYCVGCEQIVAIDGKAWDGKTELVVCSVCVGKGDIDVLMLKLRRRVDQANLVKEDRKCKTDQR